MTFPRIVSIDDYLRSAAKASGHTMTALGRAAGVSPQRIKGWLECTSHLGVEAAERLYFALTGHLFVNPDWRKLPREGPRIGNWKRKDQQNTHQ